MGVTTTPINGFTLPDDNELLRNVYSHIRNQANQLEAALRSRGLTTSDVTGYLDLVGRVNTLEAAPTTKLRAIAQAVPAAGYALWNTTDEYGLLTFSMTHDRMVTLAGVIQVAAGGTTSGTVCALPGAEWQPRKTPGATGNSSGILLVANVSDTARFCDLRNNGLNIRGTLPTAGQYISLSVTYPARDATV